MNANPKLMSWLQVVSAIIILLLFCALALLPAFGLHAADPALAETLKAVVLILVGFLFGTSVSGAKKDDAIANLTRKDQP